MKSESLLSLLETSSDPHVCVRVYCGVGCVCVQAVQCGTSLRLACSLASISFGLSPSLALAVARWLPRVGIRSSEITMATTRGSWHNGPCSHLMQKLGHQKVHVAGNQELNPGTNSVLSLCCHHRPITQGLKPVSGGY